MRVLVITNLYPPQELGGYRRSLADFVWGLQQRGHHLDVLSANAPYLGPEENGPSGERVWRDLLLKGSFDGGLQLLDDTAACARVDGHNARVIQRKLDGSPYQGILLGNLDLLGPELLPVVLEPRIPVLHHVGFIAPPFQPQHWPQASHYTLVAASDAVRRSLSAAGLPVAASPVVYPGARLELFDSDPYRRWRAAPLGQPSNPLKLCFAGLLMASKGAHTLLRAAVQLHKQGIAVQLNLAGAAFQADYWPNLQALADAEGLADRVCWFGPLDRRKLARFFRLHQVGVFPSEYPEAFGIVAAEMQASGLALVSSGVGGAAELFEHGVSGLAFQPGQADDLAHQLRRLVEHPPLLNQLQREGWHRVRERFSVATAAVALEKLWLNG